VLPTGIENRWYLPVIAASVPVDAVHAVPLLEVCQLLATPEVSVPVSKFGLGTAWRVASFALGCAPVLMVASRATTDGWLSTVVAQRCAPVRLKCTS
jgi:hypothetical protein